MRHRPFEIGPVERDRWLEPMTAALDEVEPPPEVAASLASYFGRAAEGLRNRD